jgi:hypothetical protein
VAHVYRFGSNFLAFLLDPKRNDGLRDLFIKGVLQGALATPHKTLPPSMFKDFSEFSSLSQCGHSRQFR